jgi:hypothetical protein
MNIPMTTATPTPVSNKPSFADLLKEATELGAQTGQGKNCFSQFLLKVTQAGYLGTIDVDPNKHGAGIDDAQKLTGAYVNATKGATIFNAKATNQRVTTSKARTMIRFSMYSKGGIGEPMGMLNKFLARRQQIRKDPLLVKKLENDLPNSLVSMARAQLKIDHLFTASDFDRFLFKKEAGIQTEEMKLESIRKLAKSSLMDAATAKAISVEVTKRFTAIAKAKSSATTP